MAGVLGSQSEVCEQHFGRDKLNESDRVKESLLQGSDLILSPMES